MADQSEQHRANFEQSTRFEQRFAGDRLAVLFELALATNWRTLLAKITRLADAAVVRDQQIRSSSFRAK
ncbi:MAG: hypothetical protein DWI21_18995 [Planctomycetota bacterium]|nr:MAG: hypothetical protein DWI21_18995 [Planctomycetota bacterium]